MLALLLAPYAVTVLGGSLGASFCPCRDASCCKGARPQSGKGGHCGEGEGATQMRCHHPERAAAPPVLAAAVLPPSRGVAAPLVSSPVRGLAEPSPLAGHSRILSPPPKDLSERS